MRLLITISSGLFLILLIACNGSPKNNSNKTIAQVKDTVYPVTAENANAYVPVDPSPMDMSYFPPKYPLLKMDSPDKKPPVMRVIYSRPQLKGRTLFHGFLNYGERWRLGANEATEMQVYQDVNIQGKKIKAGRYILYCIPEPDQWTIVFNTNVDSWGLNQTTQKDVEKFVIPVTHHNTRIEYFTMVFEATTEGANLIIAWEGELAKLPITWNG